MSGLIAQDAQGVVGLAVIDNVFYNILFLRPLKTQMLLIILIYVETFTGIRDVAGDLGSGMPQRISMVLGAGAGYGSKTNSS